MEAPGQRRGLPGRLRPTKQPPQNSDEDCAGTLKMARRNQAGPADENDVLAGVEEVAPVQAFDQAQSTRLAVKSKPSRSR